MCEILKIDRVWEIQAYHIYCICSSALIDSPSLNGFPAVFFNVHKSRTTSSNCGIVTKKFPTISVVLYYAQITYSRIELMSLDSHSHNYITVNVESFWQVGWNACGVKSTHLAHVQCSLNASAVWWLVLGWTYERYGGNCVQRKINDRNAEIMYKSFLCI